MAEASDHLRKTLEEFKQELSACMAEAARILAVINAIEEKLGLPRTSLGSGTGITWNQQLGEEARISDSGPTASSGSIRPDEYLGDAPLDAAKKYLRKIRRAASIDEIAEAISKGGAATKGTEWRTELDQSLLRSTREVVKVRDGTYGLVEFYTEEQLRGLRAVRRQRVEAPRKRGRPRKKWKVSQNKKSGRVTIEASEGGT